MATLPRPSEYDYTLPPPAVLRPLLPADRRQRARARFGVIRVLVVANLLLGFYYLQWRYLHSINWTFWPFALALLAAETYSYIDSWLFGLTMWRLRRRDAPSPPPDNASVDVFITCYNEPVELVRDTVRASNAITYPHLTWVLDDGGSAEMRRMAEEEGVGYIVRTSEWTGRIRHAKAGNVNNAIFQTDGEFILILDADQKPAPEILDRTLGYFSDARVAFVQTPQWFYNVPDTDPFGSQAPLFYGPIQQGKDGWNAAFFCGSNAILRREALMQAGIVNYASELEMRIKRAMSTADRLLKDADRQLSGPESEPARQAIALLRAGVRDARRDLKAGQPLQLVTYGFQRRAQEVSELLVASDISSIRAELADIPDLDVDSLDAHLAELLSDEAALLELTGRAASPLAAIETVRNLLLAVDIDREDEAIPVQPLSTISVTEDMATAMRLHRLGWKSVYHDEVLAFGLAPEDLRTALQQRLRWAQGTIQVLLRENPLVQRGLSAGQRLMYFATMWSYLSGFFAVVYLLAPVFYLLFGWLPVAAFSEEFFIRLIPFLVVNQLLFHVIGWGRPTWRGQQYSLALFPLWIKAVTSAVGSVYFGRKLGFVVTPKTRQGGVSLALIRWQLIMMVLIIVSIAWGLGRLALGYVTNGLPLLINVAWACYSLVALSAVIDAATYEPDEAPAVGEETVTAATMSGRVG